MNAELGSHAVTEETCTYVRPVAIAGEHFSGIYDTYQFLHGAGPQ